MYDLSRLGESHHLRLNLYRALLIYLTKVLYYVSSEFLHLHSNGIAGGLLSEIENLIELRKSVDATKGLVIYFFAGSHGYNVMHRFDTFGR